MAASPTSGPAAGKPASRRDERHDAAAAPASINFSDVVRNELGSRRSSIQFKQNTIGYPTGSPKQLAKGTQRKMSSPPPPSVFRPRVSFDTFEKPAEFIKETSFTLNKKHKDYEYNKRSRTFLCGFDDNDYSDHALEWLVDELVDDGDEIVCLRVVEKDDSLAQKTSIDKGRYRAEAEKLMQRIEEKNHENKAVNLILEFAIGKVQSVIDDMIKLYEPAILIVGTRGRAKIGFEGLLPGSVSKYCLQHSPVPVIVVRPDAQREKYKRKRLRDPDRHGYRDILDKSGSQGHILTSSNRNSIISDTVPVMNADNESAAVLAAVGWRKGALEMRGGGSPLTKVESVASDTTALSSATSDRASSPEAVRVMKSPNLGNLDSPTGSSFAGTDEDAGEEPSPLSQPLVSAPAGETTQLGSEAQTLAENIKPRLSGDSGGRVTWKEQ